jgi:hypothetical protein
LAEEHEELEEELQEEEEEDAVEARMPVEEAKVIPVLVEDARLLLLLLSADSLCR